MIVNEHICFTLKKLTNLIGRKLQNEFQHAGVDNSTVQNGWIIMHIHEHNMRGEDVYQKDLEKVLRVTRSTTSKVVNLMISKGYIIAESVDNDARLKKLKLTLKAEEHIAQVEAQMAKVEAIATTGLSEEELKTLQLLLNKVSSNFIEHRGDKND